MYPCSNVSKFNTANKNCKYMLQNNSTTKMSLNESVQALYMFVKQLLRPKKIHTVSRRDGLNRKLLKMLCFLMLKNRKADLSCFLFLFQKKRHLLSLLQTDIESKKLVTALLMNISLLKKQNFSYNFQPINSIKCFSSLNGIDKINIRCSINLQCLGCISSLAYQTNYNFESARQNYIIINNNTLQNQTKLSQVLCGALNVKNSFIFVANNFFANEDGFQINGSSKNNIKSIQKIQQLIKQRFKYFQPQPKQVFVTIQYIPVIPFGKYYNEFSQQDMSYIHRIKISVQNNNAWYFLLEKDTNSEKVFNVQSFVIKKGQVVKLDFETAYLNACKKNEKNRKKINNFHNNVNCVKNKIHLKLQYKKQQKFNKIKQNNQIFTNSQFKTLIQFHGKIKQGVIQGIKSNLRSDKLNYLIYQFPVQQNNKKKCLFWLLSHSCPYDRIYRIIDIFNKQGNIDYKRPTKILKIKHKDNFSSELQKSLKTMLQQELIFQNYYVFPVDKDSNEIKIVFQSLQASIKSYCWFLAESVKKIQFIK